MQFVAYGTKFGLRGNDTAALQEVADRASSLGWRRSSGGAADVPYVVRRLPANPEHAGAAWYELHCGDRLIGRATDLGDLVEAFEDHAKIETAYRAEGCLFVHAGAVSWKGRGLVIPGRSRTGKTTLVRALIEAGAEYYSDEYAVLDRVGRVHPYALPLSIRERGARRPIRTCVDRLGGRAGVLPVPVELVVVTRYRRGARWRPRRLSPGQALLALMENAVAAQREPGRTMPILRQLVLTARAVRTSRADAAGAARALLAELR